MIDAGRHSILGVRVSAVDYEAAVEAVLRAAFERRALRLSALAVHGLMCGVRDPSLGRRLNGHDLVVPDGQPLRWALRWLHGVRLPDRVYGPALTIRVAGAFAARGLPLYLYGSTPAGLEALERGLRARFPDLRIAGSAPSKFRSESPEERDAVLETIRASGARGVLVGLGCPRQEIWTYESAPALRMPVLAVGAAFDFIGGELRQAPPLLQRAGLEWAFRLGCEPRRLWRRYLLLNPLFLLSLGAQAAGLAHFEPRLPDGSEPRELPG